MSALNSASGSIQITTKNKTSKFREIIHIAILFKSNKSQVEIENWSEELKKYKPIEENFEQFYISKREWLTEAKLFIIPTLTFGETTIEINLKEHALYGTGFTIEIYHRTGTIKEQFKTTDEVTTSLGGSIIINVKWNNVEKVNIPQINFKNNS